MKISLPINLKNTDFLQTAPSLRSTWTFKAASVAIGMALVAPLFSLALHWNALPPLVPLWYSKPWGTERLVPPVYLLIPIGVSLLVYVGNLYIARRFASEHLMFSRVLWLTSALVSSLSAIIVIRIVSLVT